MGHILLPSLHLSSLSVIFINAIASKFGRNVNWMALYIQLKKMNQGTKMCFLLLYIEFVFYTDFDDYFFMFLIKYMYDRVKM